MAEGGANRGKNMLFMKEKDRFLKMNNIEKRKLYLCGNSYICLSDIEVWEDYYLAKKTFIKKNGIQQGYYFMPNHVINEKISIWTGDITALEIDAVVNAANNELIPGGGVDARIHKAAGSYLEAECRTLKSCNTGDAKITGGYSLPAKHVIHTVGPRGETEHALKSCYKKCMELLVSNKLSTIAFPCISTGVYGYPKAAACQVALRTVREFLETHGGKVQRVIFCLFEQDDLKLYQAYCPLYFPMPHSDDTPPSSPETKTRGSLDGYYK